MYARKVSLCLKAESFSQFLKKFEREVILLLRKQKGFLDHLILLSDSGKLVYVYTFWEWCCIYRLSWHGKSEMCCSYYRPTRCRAVVASGAQLPFWAGVCASACVPV
ncbi:MAG: hypothetical protein WBQ89_08400 [Candidatus Acidiferrum sp.]